MDLKEVKELLEKFDASSLTELDLKMGNASLYMNKNKFGVRSDSFREKQDNPAQESGEINLADPLKSEPEISAQDNEDKWISQEKDETIKSPIVGVIYLKAAPEKEVYKVVGDKVKKNEIVCIIEAMKLMNEITSPFDGVISEILVENEDVVEFGQPLFKVRV